MSYLKFDKTLMTNLEEALPREILRTNRSGAYHCTTIVDCNTRKYHGLLVIPVPELDDENHVLLSSLDETVIQHGAEFNLGLHKYQGDNYSPRGHKYIREFECEKVPTTIYRVEQERGYDFNEDLYVPGYFEVEIKKGESIVFSGGVSEIGTRSLKKTFEDEVEERTPRDTFRHCLINAAHQFLNKQENEFYILAGYPWFKCRARDLFISLPGLTLAINEVSKFEMVMETACKAIYNFIRNEPSQIKIYEMEHPDILLWAVWCIQQYAKMVSREACRGKYGVLLEDIMRFLCQDKHPNLILHDNGLLYTYGTNRAVTWMNSTVNGHPVIPRTGYIVEINTLWYNALRFAGELSGEAGNNALAESLGALAEKSGKSFVNVFLNEYGYLLDYVDGNMMEWSVRPNMIFAVAFDYSPLNSSQKKGVLDIVTKELLTPKGLRSLSPKSGGYNPNYVGPQIQRDYAYHQGTAWPWLAGFYFEAYLRIYKMSGIGFIERYLIGYEDEMSSHCIGSISELFDGNPPFKGRGAISFAMNVAEILRILYLLSKYNY